MRIALIGTRGVPARYGGFETCVEEVGQRLARSGHQVDVYCRDRLGTDRFLGMRRIELPAVRTRSLETISHTALAVAHAVTRRRPDAAIVFNAANSPLLPVLKGRGIPVALHMDGLEWKRTKWGAGGRRYYRYAEALGVYLADALISDAEAIARYYAAAYGRDSTVIAYGAPIIAPGADAVAALGLEADRYTLIVARLEPENHVLEKLRGAVGAASPDPIVVVGSVPYPTDYSRSIEALAASDPRVRLLGSVWDQDVLDALYAHCATYLHGHSVGGTNPSLLRAMGAGAPVAAYEVAFNRETLGGNGFFWSTPADLTALLDGLSPQARSRAGAAARQRAEREYSWDDVAARYLELVDGLASRSLPGRRIPLRTCLRAARSPEPSMSTSSPG
ncbi:MAG: DUF1972 domain-containing protein [Mycobacteriales bacterium]